MNTQKIENYADQNLAPGDVPKSTRRMRLLKSSKAPAKSKQDQLVALLSKPHGVQVSVISDRLGWLNRTGFAGGLVG